MGLVKMARDGWRYYATEIALGREDYFARHELGLWVGLGAEHMGLVGEVTPEHLERLFAEARHPETAASLGRPFGSGKAAVAGYALSFSPPKSVSVLWALGDEEVAASVRAGHDAAVRAALSHLERHAAFTRRGRGGLFQADTRGLVGAAFVHRTSRALDPQLHTHVLLANKVQAASDGRWLSIDGTELYGSQKAAGMLYKGALRSELSTRLGVSWGEVDQNGAAEIEGVPPELLEHWSTRRKEVKAEAARLVAAREADLGRSLSNDERAEAHQLAAYRTRGAKAEEALSLTELRDGWRQEAEELGHGPKRWVKEALDHRALDHGLSRDEAVTRAIEVLEESASTWSRAEATEVLSTLLDHRAFAGAAALQAELEVAVDALVSDRQVLVLSTPSLVEFPEELVRSDGLAAHLRHGGLRYSTARTLAREAEVLEAAAAGASAGLAMVHPARIEQRARAAGLGPDQLAGLRRVCGSGEAICCVVGPAGAGKSRMLGVARAAFEEAGHRVIGVAPSAMAAEVLQAEAGIACETLARLLLELQMGSRQLRARDVVVLDEASMTRSADLAELVRYSTGAGAKLVLVGDPAQLGAVGAGGLFRTLAHDTRAVELDTLRRFREPWEAHALLRLRAKDSAVIATYDERGRITHAGAEDAVEAALARWAECRAQGKAVLVMAGDHDTVDALVLRARAALVALGQVESGGVRAGRHLVGVGDEVVTLRNDRHLRTDSGEWVRNGDRWRVVARFEDGSLELAHCLDHGSLRLPAPYVREHVALGYALTVHKAQGVTVDKAVVVVNSKMSAEQLYVAMSRGREHNQAIVICEAPDTGHGRFATPSPVEFLARVLRRDGAERSATEVIRQALDRAGDPGLLRALLEEADGRVERAAGPDQSTEIAALAQRAHVQASARRLREAEEECRRAAVERQRLEAEGDHSVAEARKNEREAMASYDRARHELFGAKEAMAELDRLESQQARRERWLASHPEHMQWIERFRIELVRRDAAQKIVRDHGDGTSEDVSNSRAVDLAKCPKAVPPAVSDSRRRAEDRRRREARSRREGRWRGR